MMKEALLIFAKNLVYGEVKTRLAVTAGNELAFAVYRQLLGHTVSISKILPVNKIVFYSHRMDEDDIWDNNIYEKQVQAGNDLGERMYHAFVNVFESEYHKAVIIGTDCFELSSGIIMNAFAYLNEYDVVIGPAKDGGYYLMGMKKLYSKLFQGIRWSTDEVLKQTLSACDQLRLSTYLLPVLSDVDNENDLKNMSTNFLSKQH